MGISPVSAAGSSITRSSVLPSIATLAVNVLVLTSADVLRTDLLLADGTGGALLVVVLARCWHTLVGKHFPLTSSANFYNHRSMKNILKITLDMNHYLYPHHQP